MATKHKNLFAAVTCIILAGGAALVGLLAPTSLAVIFLVTLGPVALLCGVVSACLQKHNMLHLKAAFNGATSLAITGMAGAGLSFVMAQADFGIIILGLFGLGSFFGICLIAAVSFAIDAIETHAEQHAPAQRPNT